MTTPLTMRPVTRRRRVLLLIATFIVGATFAPDPGWAQEVPTVPGTEPVPVPIPGRNEQSVTELTSAYLSGQWSAFAPLASSLVHDIATGGAFDERRDVVQLFWLGEVPDTAGPTLLSAVVGHSLGGYSRVIPGLQGDGAPRLVEVFLTMNPDARLQTSYVSSPTENPLLTQLPAVVGTFAGPLFAALGRSADAANKRIMAATPPTVLWAMVRIVSLPLARAKVELHASAKQPMTQVAFRIEVDKLMVRIGSRVPGQAALLQSLTTALTEAAAGNTCQTIDRAACRDHLHYAITNAVAYVVTSTYGEARVRVRLVETMVRAFVDALDTPTVSGTFVLENAPPIRASFGLLTSYAWVEGDDTRAKLDKRSIAADKIGHSLSMVVLNLPLWGYQEHSHGWQARKNLRPYAGTVFNPVFGLTAGGTVMVTSNLGLNAGWAWLPSQRPVEGLAIDNNLDQRTMLATDKKGEATGPFIFTDAQRAKPLENVWLRAFYLGVSYNFK